jgi:HK97 family phage portal protein
MGFLDFFRTKSNPVQRPIGEEEETGTSGNKNKITAANAFELDSVVNRCTNILVDNSAEVNFDVKDKFSFTPLARVNKRQLNEILNIRPNPYMDSSLFRRLIYLDYWFGGRCFMYWDGASLYHLPEGKMEVVASETAGTGYIDHFLFDGNVTFYPNEIIFIKDNSFKSFGASQISATSRYMAAHNDTIRKDKLNTYKEKFIDSGTVLGLILETEQVLNRNFKNRILEDIKLNYNANNGKFSNTAFILDGGIKAKPTNQTSIADIGISEDRTAYNASICTALGVPPILLDGGNNANIRPNIQLLFYMTLLPNLKKFESAFETFFGFDLKLDTRDVPAMLPDMNEETTRIVSLVNNGIITGDEGRVELRMEPTGDPLMTTIRIPANVSGSATGVAGQEGGAPSK